MVATGKFRNRAELRRKPRRAIRYTAKILVNEKGATLPCRLADVSETGARLAIPEGSEVPDQFILLLTPHGETRRICRLVWRDGTTLGVAFSDALAASQKRDSGA